MKKKGLPAVFSMFIVACILTAIYVVLTERLSIENIALGFAISLLALFLTQKLFLKGGFLDAYALGGYYIIYVGYLCYTILKSAVISIRCIFSKNAAVYLVRYKTVLINDNLKGVMANAITLSPGTVTADIKGDVIEVMKLCEGPGENQTADFERLERVIKHMDKDEKQ